MQNDTQNPNSNNQETPTEPLHLNKISPENIQETEIPALQIEEKPVEKNPASPLSVQESTPDPSFFHRLILDGRKRFSTLILQLGKPFDAVKNFLLGRNRFGDRDFFSPTRTLVQVLLIASLGIFRLLQLNDFLIAVWQFVKQALRALYDVFWNQVQNASPAVATQISDTIGNILSNLSPLFSAAPQWLKSAPYWLREILLGNHALYAWGAFGILALGKIISTGVREYRAAKQPNIRSFQ